MAEEKLESGASAQVTTEKKSLLQSALEATKQTEPSHAEELLKTFAQEVMKGQVKFEKKCQAFHRQHRQGHRRLIYQAFGCGHAPQRLPETGRLVARPEVLDR